MFNSLLTQQHRIQQIENFISDLTTKGTISMESADMLDRLIPGGIKQIDPDFMFDIDETEEGAPIAMEAALEGLSRMKIAFVIAIIAFIVKYITGLNNNSYDFSSSGGSGGGWGGSAPAKFETKQPPTSQACHTDCDNYIELVSADIEHLREAYQEAIKDFIGINHLEIADHRQAELNNLLNNIIPRIIRSNGGGKTIAESTHRFESFLFASGRSSKSVRPETKQIKPFLDVTDKTSVTKEQLAQAPVFLKYIGAHYTVRNIFSNYFEGASDGEGKAFKNLGIPYFIVNKDIQASTKNFAKVIVNLIDGSSNLAQALDEFSNILIAADIGRIHNGPGRAEIVPLWGWLSKNLGKETPDMTTIKNFINQLDPVISEGVNLSTNDNAYYNTTFRTDVLKKFVGKTTNGDERPPSVDEKVISGFLIGEFSKAIDLTFFDQIEELSKALKEGERDIVSLTDTCKKLEESILRALGMVRYQGRDDDPQKLGSFNKDPNIVEAQENVPHMLNLVSGLLSMLLLTLAAAAKYNIDMSKLVKARCDGVIKTLQSMAQDYYDLLKSMGKIMDENLLPKNMMEKK